MNRANLVPLFGAFILPFLLADPAIAQKAQRTSSTLLGCTDISQQYEHALDIVFPRPTRGPGDFRTVDYTIVLRYQPSFHTESQIVFEKDMNGKLLAKEYALPEGAPSVLTRLWKIYDARRCPTDAELAKINTVNRSLDPVPSDVKELVIQLLEQPITLMIDPDMRIDLNSKSPRLLMEEDGAGYHLWLNGLQNSAFFDLHSGPSQSPLYDELDRLRLAVEDAK
ncbi:MAG: hypothetical protein ACYDCM_17145 [Candidatus Acidiferrales bacterium]